MLELKLKCPECHNDLLFLKKNMDVTSVVRVMAKKSSNEVKWDEITEPKIVDHDDDYDMYLCPICDYTTGDPLEFVVE